MTHYYFLSLSHASPFYACDPSFFRGREELLASLCTWTVSPFCCTLFLGTGLQTLLRGEGALGSGRLELYQEALGIVPRRARACASLSFTVLVFLGTVWWLFLGTVIIFLWNCLSGCYTRWLVRMGVVYPVETTFV